MPTANSSYAVPRFPRTFSSINPRPLLPLIRPSAHLTLYPPLPPSPQRSVQFTPSRDGQPWEVTTHVVPGAWPRTTPFVELSDASSGVNQSRESRANEMEKLARSLIELKEKQTRGEVHAGSSQDDRILWNAVNCYTRRRSGHGDAVYHKRIKEERQPLTLFLTHPNGFPKEIWEPFLSHLIDMCESSHESVSIDEVWSFEAVQHGDAAILNEGKLGDLYDWADNSRDILNFLLHYLPSKNGSEGRYPPHLHRVDESVASTRSENGYSDRTLVTVGHSFGGCTATLAALNTPALFSSLVLVDPVIVAPYDNRGPHVNKTVSGAVRRRSNWTNREEAKRLFAASPFFGAWDPAVLDVYVECGLTPNPDSGVQLKTPGRQEAVVFCESRTNREVFELLPKLDERIEIRWILSGKDAHVTGGEETTAELVWRRSRNCSNVRIASAGHLVAQEAPEELACDVYEFLRRKYGYGRKAML